MYKICWCSLAGTAACARCNNNSWSSWYIPYVPYYPTYPDIPMKSPAKKITEKFDKDGNVVERIVEESSEYNYSWKTANSGSTGGTA